MLAESNKHNINSRKLHKTAIIEAGRAIVWWKWTTHAGLKTFLGAENQVDLRPGGPYEIYFLMDNPPGLRGGEGNQVLSYLPQKMLSFTWNAPPDNPEVRHHKHKTWVVLQFEDRGVDQTQLILDHLGWLDGECWNAAYTYFDKAWDMVLRALQASCDPQSLQNP